MVKLFWMVIGISLVVIAEPPSILKNSCLNCHIKQKIPSELIYRRYLMRYSTNKKMKNVMIKYLKNPKQKLSIMPKQFFLKFPMKKAMDMNNSMLESGVDGYLRYFDIRERLILNI